MTECSYRFYQYNTNHTNLSLNKHVHHVRVKHFTGKVIGCVASVGNLANVCTTLHQELGEAALSEE